jgi:hypothetical protein
VSNRVDAAVHDMKVTPGDPSLDTRIAQAELDQLPASDHAMLAFRQPRNA